MSKSVLFVAAIISCVTSLAQPVKFDYEPHFSAAIVRNLDTSMQWYKSIFDLRLKEVMNDPNNSYRIAILESNSYTLELLELRGSLVQKEILKGQPEETKIQGHFKIGFNVKGIDACLKHLADLKVNVPHVWTDKATNKRNFLITDPDGNLIQFYEN